MMFFKTWLSNYDWKQAQENVKYQDIQVKNMDRFRRAQKATHTSRSAKKSNNWKKMFSIW